MGLLEETRFVERQQFFNGQRLFADDLQSLEAFNREMRWLHNRSLHQSGIGDGVAVRGRKGDRTVWVEPGYVLDIEGREIVLTEVQEIHVPPAAGDDQGQPVFYDLVVSYPDDEDLEQAETRAGVCAPRGVVRLREEPVFCWVRLKRTETGGLEADTPGQKPEVKSSVVAEDPRLRAEIESGLRIVVARAEILNCQLNRDLSLSERRNARPAVGPHIACGTLEVKPDLWQVVWFPDRDYIQTLIDEYLVQQFLSTAETSPPQTVDLDGLLSQIRDVVPPTSGLSERVGLEGPFGLPFGLELIIDTREACFLTTPCYNARIEGSRISQVDLTPASEDIPIEGPPPDDVLVNP